MRGGPIRLMARGPDASFIVASVVTGIDARSQSAHDQAAITVARL